MSVIATPHEGPTAGEPVPPQFQQRLGLSDATMLVAGTMIGSGIFIVSAEIARDVGSSGWLLAVWVLTGVMTVIGALSYAELAAMMPHAGGQYVYLREAYSPLWGFLYGWTLFLVIQTGTIAAVGVSFAKFLGVLVPQLGTKEEAGAWVLCRLTTNDLVINLNLPGRDGPLNLLSQGQFVFTVTAGQVVAVIVIALLTVLNCLGVQQGKWVQNIFTITKTLALILLILLGIWIARDPGAFAANMSDLWNGVSHTKRFQEVAQKPAGTPFAFLEDVPLWPAVAILMVVGGAMVGSLFSADAWNNVTFTAGEVRNPRRNLPLSLVLGTLSVIVLYILANVAYLSALPLDTIAHAPDDRVATALMERVWPALGPGIMAVAIMVSTFGCANGLILMGARLYYAMAQDGLFFQSVGQLNRRSVPAAGLILQGIWAALLTFSGTYNQLLDYVIFAALLFYVLTVVGLFVLRRKRPAAERPYRAFGYPVIPAVYVLLCAAIMLDLLIVKPLYTWPGLVIVLTGIPVYFLWRLTSRKRGQDPSPSTVPSPFSATKG